MVCSTAVPPRACWALPISSLSWLKTTASSAAEAPHLSMHCLARALHGMEFNKAKGAGRGRLAGPQTTRKVGSAHEMQEGREEPLAPPPACSCLSSCKWKQVSTGKVISLWDEKAQWDKTSQSLSQCGIYVFRDANNREMGPRLVHWYLWIPGVEVKEWAMKIFSALYHFWGLHKMHTVNLHLDV